MISEFYRNLENYSMSKDRLNFRRLIISIVSSLMFLGVYAQEFNPVNSKKNYGKANSSAKKSFVKRSVKQRDDERRLLNIIAQVERKDLNGALISASELTNDVPNFHAAQLVYADLLRFKSGVSRVPFQDFAGVLSSEKSSASNAPLRKELHLQLAGLHDEIRRRVQGADSVPETGSIPSEFLMLDASVRQAIAIDASKSRLYLFANEDGRFRVVGNFYVSVGKLGLGKKEEGDQRTPQGLYFIGRQISGMKLPEFYGLGALTMNYPNDWDRVVGRSGSGIWLHGTPPDQYARLPEASDGCVVLANPDLDFLMQTVERQTPVLIRSSLHWVPSKERPAQEKTVGPFLQVLDDWRQAWRSKDANRLASIYLADLPESEHRISSKMRLSAYFTGASDVSLQKVSVYAWNDEKGDIRIVNLRVRSTAFAEDLRLRLYWRMVGNRWRLFSEEVVGS